MTNISIKLEDIKYLREKTGVGFIICKNILIKCNNNLDQAIFELKNLSIELAKNLRKRPTKEGIIKSYVHPGNQRGALIELKCESDFVARHPSFEILAQYLAYHLTILDNYSYIHSDELPKGLKEVINPIKIFCSNQCLDNPLITIDEYILQSISEFKENIIISRYLKLIFDKN